MASTETQSSLLICGICFYWLFVEIKGSIFHLFVCYIIMCCCHKFQTLLKILLHSLLLLLLLLLSVLLVLILIVPFSKSETSAFRDTPWDSETRHRMDKQSCKHKQN